MKKLFAVVFSGMLLLTGCVGVIKVPDPVANKVNYDKIKIVGKEGFTVAPDILTKFETDFTNRLSEDFEIGEGGLVVEYRFIDPSDNIYAVRQIARHLAEAGIGSLTVEAKFYDSEGNHLGTIQVSGEASIAWFGRDVDEAIMAVAYKLYKFAVDNFRT